jgi:hypothetical protein
MIDSDKIVFMTPLEILENIDPLDHLIVSELPDKDAGQLNDSALLQREALRYLYSLEKKIKKTSDRDLLYQWRILQSLDHMREISEDKYNNRERSFSELDADSMHTSFLNFMNALSCLDLQAQQILGESIS